MFSDLLTYDPEDVAPEYREKMAVILKARGEYLRATAEVSDYRARSWSGEAGLDDIAELRAANLAKLREDYAQMVRDLVKDGVDIEGLIDLAPAIVAGILQNFKIPFPVLMEALGIDLDQLKMLVEQIKGLISDM